MSLAAYSWIWEGQKAGARIVMHGPDGKETELALLPRP
jgi:hypothetical protein